LALKKNLQQFFLFAACCVIGTFILLTVNFYHNIQFIPPHWYSLILATFVVGKEIKGSKSWIPLAFMNLQPVELCKFMPLRWPNSLQDTDFSKPRSLNDKVSAIALHLLHYQFYKDPTYLIFLLIPNAREGLLAGYLISAF
jgi:rod shape determining protein RodA